MVAIARESEIEGSRLRDSYTDAPSSSWSGSIPKLHGQGGNSQCRADEAHETLTTSRRETFETSKVFPNITKKDFGEIWKRFDVPDDVE
ncbi:Hypothetical predicted protein [Olea europaea subsp. europaea]|uniref:Uncharacterized protein n=1 Tax=Olea europaea subsp. europaea TaxID=158383 RepID=A0A8S0RW61_OLEEU|nr:Hypothetical predicted protein [Olea europaea subsp. europaea]